MELRTPFKKSPSCVIQTSLNVFAIVTLVIILVQWLQSPPERPSFSNELGAADQSGTSQHVWQEDEEDDVEVPVPRETAGPKARAGIYANVHRQRFNVPETVAQGVKRLVLFVGYPRSCHSLVASLLDAHPNVIISHEYDLVKVWKSWSLAERQNRTFVYNKIFNISRIQAYHGLRSAVPGTSLGNARDAYSYGVPNQWQGNFEGTIELIGDKHGGRTSKHLSGAGRNHMSMEVFEDMEQALKVKLVFIHVMRHPYDNIATMALKQENGRRYVNGTVQQTHLRNISYLIAMSHVYCSRLVASVATVRSKYKMIDIRCEDLVQDPVKTLHAMCSDLDLDCSHKYLVDCSRIVSSTPSRTRHFVQWPDWLKEEVAVNLSWYPFLSSRYKL